MDPEPPAPQSPLPAGASAKEGLSPKFLSRSEILLRRTLFLALLSMLLLLSTLFLAYQNMQLKKQIVALQTSPIPPISQITPTAITDPTANWKTYTIQPDPVTEYQNYSIKLPAFWKQIEHSSNFQNRETFQDSEVNHIYQLIINQEKNYNDITKKPYMSLRELSGLPYDLNKTTIDGQETIQFLPRAGGETDNGVLFFSKDKNLYFQIELLTPRDGAKLQEGPILFNQILSTFKFLDTHISLTPIQANTCGGWDTSGEIVCTCTGKLVKPACPSNALCDGASYTCTGQCGTCCYKGVLDNPIYPKCQ